MFCVPETDFDYDDHIVFGTRIVPKKDAPELDRANVDLEVEIYTGNGEQYLFSLDSAPHPFGPGMRASIDPTEDVLPPGDYQFKFKATLADSEKKNKDVLRWEPENNTFTIVEDIDRPVFPE